MERKFLKTCTYALLISLLSAGMIALATSNSFALAQSCSAQLGSPSVYEPQYAAGYSQVTVPVSAACFSYTGQLYATGTAYYNGAIVGTANTALSPVYGDNGLTGQLSFTLPTSAEYNSVQFSVSIYSTQNGDFLLATTSSTFALSPNYYGYPYSYYPSYPYYYGNYPYYSSGSNSQNSGNTPPHYSGGKSGGYPQIWGNNPHYYGSNPYYSGIPSHNSGSYQQHSGSNPSYYGSTCYYNCSNSGNSNSSHHTH